MTIQTKKPNLPPGGELPDCGYLRQSQLIPHILPFSSASLWRMVKTGKFPAPFRLGARITAWRCQDIKNWMNTRTTVGGD